MSTGSDVEYDFNLFDDGPAVLNLNRRTVAESRRKVKKVKFGKKVVKKSEAKNDANKNKGVVKSVVSRRSIPKIEEKVQENVEPEEDDYLIEPKKIKEEKEKTVVPVKKVEPIIIADDEVVGEVKTNKPKAKKKLKLFRFNKNKKIENKDKQSKTSKVIQVIKEEFADDYDTGYEGRFTEPKKRNLLGRIILQERLAKETFNYIEDEYENLTQQEIDASKKATKRRDKRLYKEVQAYEDATDDITMRRGWLGFKIGLAAVLLAGTVVIASNTINDFKEQVIPQEQAIVMQDDYSTYKEDALQFIQNVSDEQGYGFVSLSNEELIEGYVRILQYEKNMYDNQFKNALLHDQELLDRIVSRVYEKEYDSFSDEEKRDYRQLAYSMLDVAKPNLFANDNIYIRNPIICDTVEARNSAKEKGYKMGLYANTENGIHIKNVGRIITNLRLLEEADFIAASEVNEGQDFLEQIVKDALGEGYQNMNPNELKDYKQLVYEMLPDYAKEEYIKDPIDIALRYKGYEIGD